jgi:hypothetical protein
VRFVGRSAPKADVCWWEYCRWQGRRRITLWDGNYVICSVVSVHVTYETKYLAIFVAIQVSFLRDCLSSMENDLMMLAMLLESQDSKITQTEGQAIGLGEHTLIRRRLTLSLCQQRGIS